MSHRRIDTASAAGASITIAPYEYPLVWDYVGRGRYLQAAFCKATAQLYSRKFDKFTANSLSNIAAKGAFLGLLEWCKDIGCFWDEGVFESGASGGSVEVLDYLLDNGCPLAKDASTCTAAAMGGHVEALKFLRMCGCLGDNYTFLEATTIGHLNVLQFAHEFSCDWSPKRVCRNAVENGHIHILQWMHTLHIDGLFNEDTCKVAASRGKIEVLQWLRSVGCRWDARTCWKAIEKGHLNVLKWAMAEGCPWTVDDRKADNFDDTGLHVAASYNSAEILKYLLSCGVNINVLEKNGCTPVYVASEVKSMECVEVLIREGADVNIANTEGITPLGIAISSGYDEIEEILRAAGATE